MNKILCLLVLSVLPGCAESYSPAPVSDAGPAPSDAGCVITWPCVGEACPAQDIQDGVWFPCDLASSSEDRDR